MLNQVVMVGRMVADLEVSTEGEKEKAILKIAIPRSFKNADGEYETDFVACSLWDGIAKNTAEYCKKGDIVGIKGRIQSRDGAIEIIAEKVTFLSSKSKDINQEG